MACLMVGAVALHLAVPTFSLSWTHSVERVTWQEEWAVTGTGLALNLARVRGSGAGMEPGEDAVLRDGWWEWEGDLAVPSLVLAASGATGSGWTFCADGQCRDLGAQASEPVVIAPCDAVE